MKNTGGKEVKRRDRTHGVEGKKNEILLTTFFSHDRRNLYKN